MEKIKLIGITPIYPSIFEGKMVGYYGLIEDINCSSIKRDVLFLCNPSGTEISARVPNSRILFKFCNKALNIRDLTTNLEVEVALQQIEVGKENENFLSLIDSKKDTTTC